MSAARVGGTVQRLLLVAALLVYIGHALGGHVHADPITAVPVEAHDPGDAHHETTGSCDALRAVDAVALPVFGATPPAVSMPIVVAVRRAAVPVPIAQPLPPLFLLHSALLI